MASHDLALRVVSAVDEIRDTAKNLDGEAIAKINFIADSARRVLEEGTETNADAAIDVAWNVLTELSFVTSPEVIAKDAATLTEWRDRLARALGLPDEGQA